MIVDHAYRGHSAVAQRPGGTDLGFAPDLTRPGVRFDGDLALALPFREAISALNAVVVSDLRYKPKEREAYMAWLALQPLYDLREATAKKAELQAQIATIGAALGELEAIRAKRHFTYQEAVRRYFKYLYEKAKDAWFVLDPVVTVHPDEVFFEAFSQDESSYGRLGVGYEAFGRLGERQCGTTNVDYSEGLYQEFQRIRTYKTTKLAVDPGGIDVVTTDSAAWREVKIDLPDSWVRGFLQVNAAMALPATHFTLDPLDVHNLCTILARHKETHGPRALRWRLTPGEPVVAIFEPWELEVPCPRSKYHGDQTREIRTWGRRRLRLLERLIPLTTAFDVHLLGNGMPSFYVARMGPLTFTLGLSGWTRHNWSASSAFDLLAPRQAVDAGTRDAVYKALATDWLATPDALARSVGIERGLVVSALGAWAQAGRVMYDLGAGVYRARALTRDPVPLDALRFASPREAQASQLVDAHKVRVVDVRTEGPAVTLQGEVDDDDDQTHYPELSLDGDGAILQAQCGCRFHSANALHQGPCTHLLALRLQHGRTVPA